MRAIDHAVASRCSKLSSMSLRQFRRVERRFLDTDDNMSPATRGPLIRQQVVGENSVKIEDPHDGATIRERACKHARKFFDFQNPCHYFADIAPTTDWNTLKPSVHPSSGSAERSGCGIIPTILPPGLEIPAMLPSEPLGLAVSVMSPDGVE